MDQIHPSKYISLLYISIFIERFSYFGVKALFYFFLASTALEGGLELSENEIIENLKFFALLVLLFPIIGGVVSDFLLNKTNALLFSTIFISLGMFSLTFITKNTLYISFLLLAFGFGLFKTSQFTLLAIPYLDQPEKSSGVFTLNLLVINIASFLGPVSSTIFHLDRDWKLGFYSFSVLIGIVSVILYLYRKKLHTTSDISLTKIIRNRTQWTKISIILVISLGSIIFWLPYDIYSEFLWDFKTKAIQNMTLLYISPAIGVVIGLLLTILWFRYTISSWLKLSLAFFLYAFSWQLVGFYSSQNPTEYIIFIVVLVEVLLGLTDMLFTPTINSLIVQYSPRKLLGTSFGVFSSIGILSNVFIGYIGQQSQQSLGVVAFTSFTVAILIATLFLRHQKLNR